jgi:phosphoglycolate phosphatase-like HAD superfamily hydrolase
MKVHTISKEIFVFLDGDNFLWTGTHELYPIIFAKAYLMMKRELGIGDSAKIPTEDDPEFQEGVDFYWGRVGATEVESYNKMLEDLDFTTGTASYSLADFIILFKRLFLGRYRRMYRLLPGARELLETLTLWKHYHVCVVSNNTQFSVVRIVRVLGVLPYCDQIVAAPFEAGSVNAPFSKAQKICEVVGGTHATCRRVFLGGDTPGDMEQARQATKTGVHTVGFATLTGDYSRKELYRAGAALVVPDLTHLHKLLGLFEGG